MTAVEIAQAQDIPKGFLEVILAELSKAGYVRSRRGARGGYQLVSQPKELTLGEIIRFVNGPLLAIGQAGDSPNGEQALGQFWERLHEAVANICDTTTFQDLIEADRLTDANFVGSNI